MQASLIYTWIQFWEFAKGILSTGQRLNPHFLDSILLHLDRFLHNDIFHTASLSLSLLSSFISHALTQARTHARLLLLFSVSVRRSEWTHIIFYSDDKSERISWDIFYSAEKSGRERVRKSIDHHRSVWERNKNLSQQKKRLPGENFLGSQITRKKTFQ